MKAVNISHPVSKKSAAETMDPEEKEKKTKNSTRHEGKGRPRLSAPIYWVFFK